VTASPAVRRTLSAPQYLLVVLLAVWALAEVGASFVQLADPLSRFGFSLREGSLVLSVEPGSPADLAGVRPGQRLLLDRMDRETRSRIVHGAERTPATVTVPVEQDGRVRFVRMTSAPVPVSTQEWIEVGAAALVALTFIATGVALVALRPTRATWSFLLLATGYPIVQLGALRTIVPVDLLDFDAAALGVALAMTVWGAVSFTTSFPDLLPDALTRRYARILYAAASVLGVLFFVTYAGFTGPSRYTVFQIYEAVLIATLLGLIALILFQNTRDSTQRARRRWLLAGSLAGIGGIVLDVGLRLLHVPGFRGSLFDVLLALSPVTLPVSVAYAVLKQRVIDVRFAINRALVFGAFTSILVIVFSFAEFLITKLEAGRLAEHLELIAAIVVGFTFNLAHHRIEGYFERIFFRAQHEAAARLRRVASAIPHAEDATTVDALLTREPLEAFDLASATVYRRDADGDFLRVAGIGWEGAPETASFADPLIAFLASESGPLDLDPRNWPALANVPDADRPLVAVPIALRNVVMGFACYGSQKSGEAFDPEERRLLAELASAAAAAYVHLTAESLRREVTMLRGALDARGLFSSP